MERPARVWVWERSAGKMGKEIIEGFVCLAQELSFYFMCRKGLLKFVEQGRHYRSFAPRDGSCGLGSINRKQCQAQSQKT